MGSLICSENTTALPPTSPHAVKSISKDTEALINVLVCGYKPDDRAHPPTHTPTAHTDTCTHTHSSPHSEGSCECHAKLLPVIDVNPLKSEGFSFIYLPLQGRGPGDLLMALTDLSI